MKEKPTLKDIWANKARHKKCIHHNCNMISLKRHGKMFFGLCIGMFNRKKKCKWYCKTCPFRIDTTIPKTIQEEAIIEKWQK